jgi:hypothetical protein
MGLQPFFGPWPLFQFLNPYTVGRTPWTGYQPVARPLPTRRTTQTQNKRTQTSMSWVGFEPTILVFQQAKIAHALDRAATVICLFSYSFFLSFFVSFFLSLWLYSPLDLGRFFSFLILYTVGRTLGWGISPSQRLYLHTKQHKRRINAHRHPCLEWDSSSRPQCSSGRRRFTP